MVTRATTLTSVPSYVYFDKQALMKQTMNEKEIQEALINDFITFFPSLLVKSKTAINQLDRKAIKHIMHQMKASVALFNGMPLYTEINSLENSIHDMNEREVLLKAYAVIHKSEALHAEVLKFQNENK